MAKKKIVKKKETLSSKIDKLAKQIEVLKNRIAEMSYFIEAIDTKITEIREYKVTRFQFEQPSLDPTKVPELSEVMKQAMKGATRA